MNSDRLQKLRDKAKQLRDQIRTLETAQRQKERKQERRDDARLKIIVGAISLEHMTKNRDSAFTKTLWPLLHSYVDRPEDRALINAAFREAGLKELPPKSANEPEGEVAKSDFDKAAG